MITESTSQTLPPTESPSIRAVPPPEMVANLRADNIDGFLGPDPFNQRAVYDGVGFIHILSKEIWDGHPCCGFAASPACAWPTPRSSPRSSAATPMPPDRKSLSTVARWQPDRLAAGLK